MISGSCDTAPRYVLSTSTGELGLYEGMKVVLFQDDGDERFEVSAVLKRGDTPAVRWLAFANMTTFQRIGISPPPPHAPEY
jgi:hypothetical protein